MINNKYAFMNHDGLSTMYSRVQLFGPPMVVVMVVGLEKNEASCLVDMHSLIKHITKDQNPMHVRCNICKFGDFFGDLCFQFC
jgi:hypothetical protein